MSNASSLGSIPNIPQGTAPIGVWVDLEGDVVVTYGPLSDQIPTLLSSVFSSLNHSCFGVRIELDVGSFLYPRHSPE